MGRVQLRSTRVLVSNRLPSAELCFKREYLEQNQNHAMNVPDVLSPPAKLREEQQTYRLSFFGCALMRWTSLTALGMLENDRGRLA